MLEITLPTDLSTDPSLVIITNNLTKEFNGVAAVNEISLTVPRGKIFGFIGPSGCGKTTAVRLLVGTYQPTSGEISVLGRAPQQFRRQDREKIGYMPQQFVLYPDLTVRQNLNFAASLYGLGWRDRRASLIAMLELVELSEHAHKLARNISGGMQRRLSLASTMMHDPELLFLDEPTAGVDPVLRNKFWDYFRTLKEKGHTLFITTQYVNEAAYCDYVGVMADGRLLMVETPDGLRNRALGGDLIHLRPAQTLSYEQFNELSRQPFVKGDHVTRLQDRLVEILVEDASTVLPRLLIWCEEQNIDIESATEYVPPFDDIFVKLVQEETADV
jgi:ABC-2 type transport system ATP-binding protein